MTENPGKMPPAAERQETAAQKRREDRYRIPESHRQSVILQVKKGNDLVPAVLGNFSRSGILFECPVSFRKGEHAECTLAIPLLSREISFFIEIKYCYEDHGSSLMGASIDAVSDEVWFAAFVEVYDLIVLRQSPA